MVSDMVQWHSSFALHKPDAVCELVGRQAWDRQALMRAIIILGYALLDQSGQFLIVGPGLVSQPVLQRAHKALGNPIGLWAMASNEDVDEFLTARQFPQGLGGKVYTPVRDQKLQFRGQQEPIGPPVLLAPASLRPSAPSRRRLLAGGARRTALLLLDPTPASAL